MGVVAIFSRLLTTWIAFLYPAFASYKALSHRPVSEPELERWVKYWSVVGAFVGAEYLFEWIVSWVPFYWEVKTAIVLYLALPQTQGSTYIYDKYLGPYFQRNEVSIDRNIETAQKSLILFARERLQAIVQFAWDAVTQAQAQVRSQQEANAENVPPAGSPAAVVQNLWRTYGSSIIAGISRASAASGQPGEQNAAISAGAGTSSAGTSANLQSRAGYTSEE